MDRAIQRAFVNPPAIRDDVHAEKVALCARVTATLGTATVKINSYGHRFPLDGPVFSFKDWLCFDQLQPRFLFCFELPSLLLKHLPSFSKYHYWYYCILSAMHSCARALMCV